MYDRGGQSPDWFVQWLMGDTYVLIPCRRVNRIDDPYGVYITADKQVLVRPSPNLNLEVIGQWIGSPSILHPDSPFLQYLHTGHGTSAMAHTRRK